MSTLNRIASILLSCYEFKSKIDGAANTKKKRTTYFNDESKWGESEKKHQEYDAKKANDLMYRLLFCSSMQFTAYK